MKFWNNLFTFFLSSESKRKIEKTMLYVAMLGFVIHLILIYCAQLELIDILSKSALLKNPISAIYTPFSFILVYEVYLLIYYLPKSFTTYITKQYEIITLIIIRKLFKDLAALELSSDWFSIKGDLQFTYDILASIILFYLIYQFQKNGMQKATYQKVNASKIERFISIKKKIAVTLIPLFFIMATITLFGWGSDISFNSNDLPSFETINNLFFDEFFTALILVDVIILLNSFFYSDQFHKIIRNSGFVISTILIRISFGATGLISTILIIVAVLFGLLILLIHNKFEKQRLRIRNTS
jgi:hypothetical protein